MKFGTADSVKIFPEKEERGRKRKGVRLPILIMVE
jgi:hypothetical protein